MPAYVIAQIEVTDPETYREYVARVPATIEQYGGRFIVRAGRAEQLEGGTEPRRIVVVEFPTFEQAKAWYGSTEYAPLIALRQSASRGELLLVEGL
jgi:uncharacterized protein (DUF1330 family)